MPRSRTSAQHLADEVRVPVSLPIQGVGKLEARRTQIVTRCRLDEGDDAAVVEPDSSISPTRCSPRKVTNAEVSGWESESSERRYVPTTSTRSEPSLVTI